MEKFCVATEKLCHDIVSQVGGIFYRDGVFLGRDRVGQARSFLSRHNFICCDRVDQGKGKLCRDKASLCCHRVG